MKKTNQYANPFTASSYRLFHIVAGTLIGAMVVTQASAMLPTPEPALTNPAAVQAATTDTRSNVQAVNTTITASLVSVDANGQETLVPVTASTRLQPGTIIEYQGAFTNNNADRVRAMTVTMSIPEQVELLGGVMPSFPMGSVDSTAFSMMPLRGQVDGQTQEIPLSFYKAVRWNIEGVGLNESATVKYRAKVK
jgi:hypothetical protein